MEKFNFKHNAHTSVEQSRKLLEMGLKPETADMHATNMSFKGKNYQDKWTFGMMPYTEVKEGWEKWAKDSCWELIPAWSFTRLKEILPRIIFDNDGNQYELTMFGDDITYLRILYYDAADSLFSVDCPDIYDSIIWMIDWLKSSGHIKECKEYFNE